MHQIAANSTRGITRNATARLGLCWRCGRSAVPTPSLKADAANCGLRNHPTSVETPSPVVTGSSQDENKFTRCSQRRHVAGTSSKRRQVTPGREPACQMLPAKTWTPVRRPRPSGLGLRAFVILSRSDTGPAPAHHPEDPVHPGLRGPVVSYSIRRHLHASYEKRITPRAAQAQDGRSRLAPTVRFPPRWRPNHPDCRNWPNLPGGRESSIRDRQGGTSRDPQGEGRP